VLLCGWPEGTRVAFEHTASRHTRTAARLALTLCCGLTTPTPSTTDARYRTLEPAGGWIVRPQIEPHGESEKALGGRFLATTVTSQAGWWKHLCCWCGVHARPQHPNMHDAGMDNADNVEGFMAEKAGVARRRPSTNSSSSSSNPSSASSSATEPDLLCGAPYRVSSSASASKDQVLVQVGGCRL
jgi:hypothetical protein